MSTEEKDKEIEHLLGKLKTNGLFGSFNEPVRASHLIQLMFYQALFNRCAEKWGMPFNVSQVDDKPMSVMQKVEEYNKTEDDEFKPFNPLLAEVKDGEKVIGGDTDSIIIADGDMHSGFLPPQEFRTIYKELVENMEKAILSDEDKNQRRIPAITIEYPWYCPPPICRNLGESREDFSARLKEEAENFNSMCWKCQRAGCPQDLKDKTKEADFCQGFNPYHKKEKEELNCVICDAELEDPDNFPRGFPDEWKACCYCVEAWCKLNGLKSTLEIYNLLSFNEVNTRIKTYGEKMKEVFKLCPN